MVSSHAEADGEVQEPPPEPQPILVVTGPAGGGAPGLVSGLCSNFPDKFMTPKGMTDRKPAKGETPTDKLSFVSG